MSEIERLAAVAAEEVQAIAKETFQGRSHLYIYPDADEMRRVVRAILQAMREPSDGMEAAMWNAVEAPVPDADSDGTTGRVWKAGIDYLLAE